MQGREKRPGKEPQTQPQPAPAVNATSPQRVDQQKQRGIPREIKEKKVWKVITKENDKNSDQKEPDNKENGRQGK